ncbi:MAG TPA: hypothetical protein DCS31_11365 [Candidatus Competibacteraceae bacterium]|nr:hypothetical protein [Candidatus Competibacteraceae bacterium]
MRRNPFAFDQVEGVLKNIAHDSVGCLHQGAHCRIALIIARPTGHLKLCVKIRVEGASSVVGNRCNGVT